MEDWSHVKIMVMLAKFLAIIKFFSLHLASTYGSGAYGSGVYGGNNPIRSLLPNTGSLFWPILFGLVIFVATGTWYWLRRRRRTSS
jgi:LPXTG-motif cell wall-anchored protein